MYIFGHSNIFLILGKIMCLNEFQTSIIILKLGTDYNLFYNHTNIFNNINT